MNLLHLDTKEAAIENLGVQIHGGKNFKGQIHNVVNPEVQFQFFKIKEAMLPKKKKNSSLLVKFIKKESTPIQSAPPALLTRVFFFFFLMYE